MQLVTLILVIRTREGIAVVSDTVTTANTTLEIYGEETEVEYHIYKRRKISKMHNFAIIHAGLSFVNGKTITQITDAVHNHEDGIENCSKFVKESILKELKADPVIPKLTPESLIVSIGIVGYHDQKPFVYRIIFFRGKEGEELLDTMESEDAFVTPFYGIDYFGDYDFVQMVIRAAKKENLLKPFDILTINEALDFARSLMRFLIEFQKYMVQFTVAYPIESAIITTDDGFTWVDRMEFNKFHYDDHD